MATCPRCGHFLEDNHTCTGLWRLRVRFWLRVAAGGLVGALVSLLVLPVVFGSVSWWAMSGAALVGMLIAFAVLRGAR